MDDSAFLKVLRSYFDAFAEVDTLAGLNSWHRPCRRKHRSAGQGACLPDTARFPKRSRASAGLRQPRAAAHVER